MRFQGGLREECSRGCGYGIVKLTESASTVQAIDDRIAAAILCSGIVFLGASVVGVVTERFKYVGGWPTLACGYFLGGRKSRLVTHNTRDTELEVIPQFRKDSDPRNCMTANTNELGWEKLHVRDDKGHTHSHPGTQLAQSAALINAKRLREMTPRTTCPREE